MFTHDLFGYFLQNCLIYLCLTLPGILAEEDAEMKSHGHLEEIFREHLIPDLGGKIPSAAFDWTRLVFNNLDSRGISIPEGIPSSDRLSDGRSDEMRLILTSDSKYASEIPSTYIIRSPVKFSLFPNPEEKPESELDDNNSNNDDDSLEYDRDHIDHLDFAEWNADRDETCKHSDNCKTNLESNNNQGEPAEYNENNNKGDEETYTNNYDPMEHEEPHLLSRHRKVPFIKNSGNTEHQNDEADENKNLHYHRGYPRTATRFLPSNSPRVRTSKEVNPLPSHLHHHRDFHHQLALNYILSNLRKHPKSFSRQRDSTSDLSSQKKNKPSLMAVVFTPAIKIPPKKVRRNSMHNVLKEFWAF